MTDLDRAKALHTKSGHKWSGTERSGVPPWFARAIGANPSTVQRWGEDNWPDWARMILTLLEIVPPDQWPTQWRATNHDAN